jgi:O-antigen ligase
MNTKIDRKNKKNYLWLLFFILLPLISVRVNLMDLHISIPMILVLLIFILQLLRNNYIIRIPTHFLFIIILLFFLWQMIGIIYTLNLNVALRKGLGIFFATLVFITVYNFFSKEFESLKRFYLLMFISSGFFMGYLLYEYLFVFKVDYLGLNTKYPTQEGKNSLAFYLAFITPVSLSYLFANIKHRRDKIIILPFITLNILALFFTSSRGAWLAVFLTLIINIFTLGKKGYKVIIFLVIIGVLGFFLSPDSQKDRFLSILNSENNVSEGGSLSLRMHLINLSLDLINERPLTGWGTGSFSTLSRERGLGGLTSHNDFTLVAVENGIIGFILFIFIFITLFLFAIKYLKIHQNDWLKRGVLSSVICLLIYLFFINAIDSIFLWINIGLLFSVMFQSEKSNIKNFS